MAIERAYIERPPRIQPELPRREVDIPTPPAIDRASPPPVTCSMIAACGPRKAA